MSQVFSENAEIPAWQRIASLLGRDFPLEQAPEQLLSGYPAIQSLIRNLSTARTEVIDLQSCEMIDAELVNQELVLEAPPAWLSQLFAQEIALLRWRARRMNAEPASLSFGVDIRQYVAVSALEVASLQQERKLSMPGLQVQEWKRVDRRVLSWTTIIEDDYDAERQLRYFNTVSALFEPSAPANDDPVSRGMRLIMRMIMQSGGPKNRDNLIILPTSHSQFLSEMR